MLQVHRKTSSNNANTQNYPTTAIPNTCFLSVTHKHTNTHSFSPNMEASCINSITFAFTTNLQFSLKQPIQIDHWPGAESFRKMFLKKHNQAKPRPVAD